MTCRLVRPRHRAHLPTSVSPPLARSVREPRPPWPPETVARRARVEPRADAKVNHEKTRPLPALTGTLTRESGQPRASAERTPGRTSRASTQWPALSLCLPARRLAHAPTPSGRCSAAIGPVLSTGSATPSKRSPRRTVLRPQAFVAGPWRDSHPGARWSPATERPRARARTATNPVDRGRTTTPPPTSQT